MDEFIHEKMWTSGQAKLTRDRYLRMVDLCSGIKQLHLHALDSALELDSFKIKINILELGVW